MIWSKRIKNRTKQKQEKVFYKLKERFIKEPVLAVPDLDKNKNGSRYIRLYNRRCFIYRV